MDNITVRSHESQNVWNHQSLNQMFKQLFLLTSKETSRTGITVPLWGKTTNDQWIPNTKGQSCGKYFHVMTSSWNRSLEYLIQSENITQTKQNKTKQGQNYMLILWDILSLPISNGQTGAYPLAPSYPTKLHRAMKSKFSYKHFPQLHNSLKRYGLPDVIQTTNWLSKV